MENGLWGQTLWMLIWDGGLGTDMGLLNIHCSYCEEVGGLGIEIGEIDILGG